MPEQKEKTFVSGMYFEKKDTAPVYVIGSLSLKVGEVVPFLQLHEKKSGYVNVDIKQAQSGKYYCELNTWIPQKDKVKEEETNQTELNNMGSDKIEYPEEDINPDDIPF